VILFRRKEFFGRVRFRCIRRYGEVSIKGLIFINIRRHRDFRELCDTFLHECLHILRPSWGEEVIRDVVFCILRLRLLRSSFFIPIIDKYLAWEFGRRREKTKRKKK